MADDFGPAIQLLSQHGKKTLLKFQLPEDETLAHTFEFYARQRGYSAYRCRQCRSLKTSGQGNRIPSVRVSDDFRFITDPRLGHDDNCEPVAASSLVIKEMKREMSNDIRSGRKRTEVHMRKAAELGQKAREEVGVTYNELERAFPTKKKV